jgi:hypothetical protein
MQSVQPESSAARRIAALLAFVCAACLWVWASKEFVKPVAKPAASYPAHDTHSDEMVTAAADPTI